MSEDYIGKIVVYNWGYQVILGYVSKYSIAKGYYVIEWTHSSYGKFPHGKTNAYIEADVQRFYKNYLEWRKHWEI